MGGAHAGCFRGSTPPSRSTYDLSLSSATRFEAFTIHVKTDTDLFSGGGQPAAGGRYPEVNLVRCSTPRFLRTGGLVDRAERVWAAEFRAGGLRSPYFINYAQSPTATAPVRELRIVQQLDPSLDERSFQLGRFAWAI